MVPVSSSRAMNEHCVPAGAFEDWRDVGRLGVEVCRVGVWVRPWGAMCAGGRCWPWIIITREGDGRCKPPPHRRALAALVYLRRYDTLAEIAAGCGVSVGTAYAYVTAVVGHLADRAPGLLKVLRETDLDHALLDGTLAEYDRVGDGRADYSAKYKRHGVNVQVVNDPVGKILWLSPVLPGRTHDLPPPAPTGSSGSANAKASPARRHGPIPAPATG